MKLWKKASGALKDKNSIFIASLSRRTSYRNPDLETAVIKATSHDDTRVDYKNAQRVFEWIRASPVYIKPLVWSLSTRLEKTRSWVVALKGLMLMHGVFFLKTPSVKRIGRLPFDLSNFHDANHSNSSGMWSYNAFIRAYFTFLDQKSIFFCMDSKEEKNVFKQIEEPMVQQLIKLQHFQTLLDMLIQVKPHTERMRTSLILEAMDCIMIEIFDVYSRICNGIARVLIRIYGAGKIEATMTLNVLQKATVQGEQLSKYFEFCRVIGILNASECPKVEKIPEEDIKELEKIINGVTENNVDSEEVVEDKERALVVVEEHKEEGSTKGLKTVITDKWEVFEEDMKAVQLINVATQDLIETSLIIHPCVNGYYKQELPDLITF